MERTSILESGYRALGIDVSPNISKYIEGVSGRLIGMEGLRGAAIDFIAGGIGTFRKN